MAKVVIAELDIDIQALLKTTSDLKKEIDALKNTQKDLAASGQSTSEAFIQNEAVLKTLTGAYSNNIKVIQESGKATATQADQTELLNLALTQEATSISEAREQNKLLNKLRNETNTTTKEGQAQLAALNAKLDQNNAFIKANGDQYLKQKINIGNYKESIKEALSELNLFNGGLQQFGTVGKVAEIGFKLMGQEVQNIKNSFAGFTSNSKGAADGLKNIKNETVQAEKATIGFRIAQQASAAASTASTAAVTLTSGALKIFRLALISTGIGAVVVALGSLIAFLSTSQEGIDAVTRVTRPLQAIMSSLIGVLQNVGSSLFSAFTNPKKALSDLAEFVKQNLVNRFKAFGEILKGIITLDFKKVTNGVLQATTGVTNLTDKIGNAAKATGKLIDAAAKKGAEIDKLNKEIQRAEIAYQRAQIKTNDLIDEQKLKLKDTSLSFKERAAAANEIIRLTSILGGQEESIIQKKIKALKLEQSMKGAKALTFAEQQQLVDLEKQLDEAQDRGLNARIENSKVLSGLKKEEKQQIVDNAAERKKADEKKKAEDLKKIQDAIALANAELNLFLETNKSKLEGEKDLTQELITEEENRLKLIQQKKLANLATDKQVDVEKLNQKKANNEQLTVAELEYETARIALASETDLTIAKNKKALEEQIAQQKADQLAAQKEIDLANAENQLQADLIANQQAYDAELAQLTKALEDKKLTEDQFREKKKQADAKQAEMDKLARINNTQSQLQEYQKVIAGLEGLFGKQKALASATALINGGLAVMEILKTPSILPEPIASISRAVQVAGVVGTTAKNIAQINGAKFEQGGIAAVGGNRHAQGGTKFYGEDGSMFEAEKGEGIGVLNRKAFASFLDFNNSFNGGRSAKGFFQGGGIITQGVRPESMDLNMIVDAIAQLPPPVVAVEEIQTVGNRFVNVKANADF